MSRRPIGWRNNPTDPRGIRHGLAARGIKSALSKSEAMMKTPMDSPKVKIKEKKKAIFGLNRVFGMLTIIDMENKVINMTAATSLSQRLTQLSSKTRLQDKIAEYHFDKKQNMLDAIDYIYDNVRRYPEKMEGYPPRRSQEQSRIDDKKWVREKW